MKGARHCWPWVPVALASTLTGMVEPTAIAQSNHEPGSGLGSPYPLYNQPEPARYNLKWGKLLGRLNASAAAEYNDNLNLANRNPQADFSLGPDVSVAFLWPISRANTLELDLGAGYRWYVDHPAISTLNLAPNSHLDYRLLFGHGQLSLHDTFSVANDPTTRPDLSGNSSAGNVINFRRINNVLGVSAEWRPREPWSMTVGYDYGLDRSLNDEFTSIDRDDHSFSAGTYYRFSPRLLAGISGASTLTYYVQDVQNNVTGYSLGPVVILNPSPFITVDLRGGYSVAAFESTGTVTDTSDFRGFTGQAGLRHKLNRWMSHELRLSKSMELGISRNYYDLLDLQYGFNARLNRVTTLSTSFQYEHFRTSGPDGERGDRYSVSVGARWQLARQWQLGAGYTFNSKHSDLPASDYSQNRFTLGLTRQF